MSTLPFSTLRKTFFSNILQSLPTSQVQFVMTLHLVSDVEDFIAALEQIGRVALIIAIPYSVQAQTYEKLAQKYPIVTPTLDALLDATQLMQILKSQVSHQVPTVLLEIGGYFAKALPALKQYFGGNLLGAVEDTEAGHRQYDLAQPLNYPVISVARSCLKSAEDFLIGEACLYAAQTLFKRLGSSIEGHQLLVLGYGKIGRGVAYAFRKQNIKVMVYDTNPIKRTLAFSEGFVIPEKSIALQEAHIILGATGNYSVTEQDFSHIRAGAFLMSASSKKLEFDVALIKQKYPVTEVINHNLVRYSNDSHDLLLVADGQPVNFAVEKTMVGPIISLVQGEMLCAVKKLLSTQYQPGLHELMDGEKTEIAQLWIETFCEPRGVYKKLL